MATTGIEEQLEFLRQIPSRHLPEILNLAQERHFAPSTVLFREGTVHHEFHVVIVGHIRLAMTIPNRGEIPLLTVGPGDVLAWSALVSEGMMTSSAVALENVRTLAFDGPQLRSLCDGQPDIGYHIMKQLARALSRRLVATRLQLLDLFASHEPILESLPGACSPVDDQC
ncbi:MAG: cyclic nucleotide-binding domain-containing protein [Planctomycetes bacterium]|nr:cyclic nucleotide-binding domain-containing protein [Planctomycetota bacterium]